MTETVRVGKKELTLVLVRRGPASWSVLYGNKLLGHIWKRDPELFTEEMTNFHLAPCGEWAGVFSSGQSFYNAGPRESILRWLAARTT